MPSTLRARPVAEGRCRHREADAVPLSSSGSAFRPARDLCCCSPLMRARRCLSAGLSVLLAGVALAACGAVTTSPAAGTFTSRTRGVLTVATSEVPRPGFWEGTPARVTGGFEFELAKLLAERLGLRAVRVRIVPFHRIVEGRLDGADLALDLVTPTTERARSLTFSAPYLDAAPTVVVRAG